MAARQAPQLRVFRNDFEERGARARRSALARHGAEQPRRDRRARDRRDGPAAPDEDRAGRLRLPLAALEGAALRAGREPARAEGSTVEWPCGRTQVFADVPLDHRLPARRGRRARGASRSRRRRLRADAGAAAASRRSAAERDAGSTSPSRPPTSRSRTCGGEPRSLRGAAGPARGRSSSGRAGRAGRARPSRRSPAGATRSREPGSARSPSPSTRPRTCRRSAPRPPGPTLPVVAASEERGPELRDPQPPPLHEPAGPAPAHGLPRSTRRGES